MLLQSGFLSRSTRVVLGKAGKAIAEANTRAAQLEAENHRLKYQSNRFKITRTRKRIQINPNERFFGQACVRSYGVISNVFTWYVILVVDDSLFPAAQLRGSEYLHAESA